MRQKQTKQNKIKAWHLRVCRSKEAKYIDEDTLVGLYLALDSIAYSCYEYDITWSRYCKFEANGVYISDHDYAKIEKLAEQGNSYAKWIVEFIEELTDPKRLLILRIKRLLETTCHIKLNSAPLNGFILVCEGNTLYEIEEELVKRISEMDEEVKKIYEVWKERMKKWEDKIPQILETFKPYTHRRIRFELRDFSHYLDKSE
jgi:hypothetical protein